MGYGVIEGERDTWRALTYGCVSTKAGTPFVDRLEQIYRKLTAIISQYAPDLSSVEELFFYTNVKTAIQVGQARGVILLILRQSHIPIQEFTPLEVKQAITNYGHADKTQIQKMVRFFLHMNSTLLLQDDAADALALALTAGFSFRSH